MFMPERSIFLRYKTLYGIDGGVPDWILSPKDSTQFHQKRPKEKPSFSAFDSYYWEQNVYAREKYIFQIQDSLWNWWRGSGLNFKPKRFHSIPSKTAEWDTFFSPSASLITGSKMFMPERSIFLRYKTLYKIDSGVWEWILSQKDYTQSHQKRPNENPSFSASDSYYWE
jgi:hypothetical protein